MISMIITSSQASLERPIEYQEVLARYIERAEGEEGGTQSAGRGAIEPTPRSGQPEVRREIATERRELAE